MKKASLILVLVLVLSSALMIVLPAMAKPYQITVIVKNIPDDETGVWVRVYYPDTSTTVAVLGTKFVDVHGKAVLDVPNPIFTWVSGYSWRAEVYDTTGIETHDIVYFTPTSKYSNRVVLEWDTSF